jgi:hypothetical protein
VAEKVTREWFEIYLVWLPDEMHIYPLDNNDFARSRTLVVQRSWRHGSAS